MKPQFVAIDGEGYTRQDGTHIYNLIAASTGECLLDQVGNGLRTIKIMDWLFELKEKYPSAVFVGFYFSYDVNMILKNIPKPALRSLAKNGFCRLEDRHKEGYITKIDYMPVKFFTVSRGYATGSLKAGTYRYAQIESLTIWDVWGFFQGSFLQGMHSFKIGTTEELEMIRSMKATRDDFDEMDVDQIIEYNQLECKLLVEAMNKLADSLETAQLKLSQWHGAGAVAMAIFKRFGVTEHIKHPQGDFELPVLSAYFGGRIEAIQIGEFKQTFGHDLISAYPSCAMYLPSLRDSEQVKLTEYDDTLQWVVWHVKWRLPSNTLIRPFPFRQEDGTITYPYEGEGYYWACEVQAGMAYYSEYIAIIEGFQFAINDDTLPFDFIPQVFAERARFKADGNHAEKALKLGLNSLYGKCAQGKSYGGRIPKSQCYIWAGLITAMTRCQVFSLAMQSPNSVIGFATDGVFSTKQLTEEVSGLGGWEVNEYRCFFNIKPGFYRGRRANGGTIRHYRGFRQHEIKFYQLQKIWRTWGILGRYETETRRFIGMKAAKADFSNWTKWIDSTKTMNFHPIQGDIICTYDPAEFDERKGLRYVILGQALNGVSKPYSGNDDFEDKDKSQREEKLICV